MQHVGGLQHGAQALHGDQMQHVEHIGFAGAGFTRHAQMGRQTGLVQMRGRGIQRHINQFHHAGCQRPGSRRIPRVVRVVQQKCGVGAQ
ncbi:hypothetical protein D3C72_2184540 [compost metagenome]